MAQDTPSRKLDQYIVRFPDGMRDLLKNAAAANNRSMNAEIIKRLMKTISDDNAARLEAAKSSMASRLGEASETEILDGIRKIIAEELDKRS